MKAWHRYILAPLYLTLIWAEILVELNIYTCYTSNIRWRGDTMYKNFIKLEKILTAIFFVFLLPYTANAMTIEKTAVGPFPWHPGGTGSYQVVVTNTGSPIAPGTIITVHDDGNFPAPPLSLTGISSDPGWVCSSGQCTYTVGSTPIPVGTTWTFTINVNIDAAYAGGVVQNCVELTKQQLGAVATKIGCACASVSIEPVATSFTLNKTAVGTPWQAGGTGSYQIVVTNSGGTINSGTLVVQDDGNFPSPPLTMTSITGDSNWDCISSPGQCSYIGSYPIPSGSSWTFTVNVSIDATYAGGTVQNCAELILQQAGPPVNQASGCANANIGVAQPTGTAITKTAIGPLPWQAGGTGSYNIVVTNTGGVISGGTLVVHDDGNFPSPPLTLTSIISGSDWDCTSVSGQCSYIGLYPIAAGASWTFTVNVGIDASYSGGTLNNCAELTLQGAGPPQLLGNSCASANVSSNSSGFCTTDADCVGPVLMSCISNMCVPMICASNQNGGSCNDGNACTVNDTCSNQACIGTPVICDDGNATTTDSCNPIVGCIFTPVAQNPSVNSSLSVQMKHSPRTFSTGSKGTLRLKAKNKGNKLGKGMLTVVDHMPAGLSVKTGTFRAGSWRCKGGMVSSSGQDVTCSYNRTLNKRGRATLNLNVIVAPKSQFPTDAGVVENCVSIAVQGAVGVVAAPKVCDKIRIKRASKTGMLDLAPLGGLIMQLPQSGGGSGPVRKVPGAVP
jgi:hypothetical protein